MPDIFQPPTEQLSQIETFLGPMRDSLRGLAEAVHHRAVIDMKDVPELPVPDLRHLAENHLAASG